MFKLVPSSYRLPVHLKLHDRTSDPQNHIDAFKNAMLISRGSDAMHCKAFPATWSCSAMFFFFASIVSWGFFWNCREIFEPFHYHRGILNLWKISLEGLTEKTHISGTSIKRLRYMLLLGLWNLSHLLNLWTFLPLRPWMNFVLEQQVISE